MKKFILGLVLLLNFGLVLNAHAFRVKAQIQLTQTHAVASVMNYWGAPMVCSGNAAGLTVSGLYIYSYMNNVVVYPGQYAYVNVYTNIYDPFFNAVDSINCFWY
ncbi:MAG: hypothetical protein U0T83_10240 [Bacteriovoracaceae bacterium]